MGVGLSVEKSSMGVTAAVDFNHTRFIAEFQRITAAADIRLFASAVPRMDAGFGGHRPVCSDSLLRETTGTQKA